ncbi:MAG: hypothetical protein MJZ33_01125 [Paludibacteraceae bacterium]|nr:hypothetical protein [Paludibacteraceae bacterium]
MMDDASSSTPEITFTDPIIMENTWAIHFTDNRDGLANSHGFTFGTNDFIDLANTADGRDYPITTEKGFDFAFLLTSPSELYARCDDAFVFNKQYGFETIAVR